MKQYLKYWCSPGYPGYPSNTLPVHNVEKRRVPWNCVVFPIISQVRDPPLGNRCTKVYFFLAFVVGRHSVTFFLHFSPPFCQSTWNNLWVLDFKDAPHTYKSWPGEENGGPGLYFIINVRWEQWTNCNWCCQHLHFQKGFWHVYEISYKSFL